MKDIPAALFGAVECPPEGEADLIIVGDSSFALVANHDNPVLCSRLSFGELLQSKEYAISQIRSVYPGLKWGKGLSAINHQIWELIEKVERENRLQNRATLPIMVVVGWAGNDVHGDFGYQGCTWIHQTNLTKSEADRKVAAEYVDKQYKKVQRSLDGLVEISKDPRVLSVQVIGNGDHSGYSLPPSYNREMGKHINWLAERGIQCVNSTMLAQGGKYDNYHLHDHHFNRKLVYRFLRGAITFHLKYVELMTKKEDLKYYVKKFISSEQDRVAAVHLFPTMVQFRLALLGTQEVMEAVSTEKKTATPAQVFDEADEEILMWVHAGILEANEEATRGGRPKPTAFTDEEISSIVPVDPSVEDYETEEVRARHYLQEDLNQAIADGFSTTTIESIEINPENTDVEDDVEVVPEYDEWDVIADDKVIINPYDEKVKEDAISEDRAKEIEDLNKIIEITSTEAKPSGTTASETIRTAATEASDKADEGEDKMKSSRISTWSVVGDDDSKPSDMTSSRISTWTEVGGSEATPMDVDTGKKKDADAAREGVPTDAAIPEASASSEQPADKTAIVDLTKTEKKVEVDKPVGKPAEKKMPKSEKQKAPESKAMPRQKAPRLSVEADAALRKLEEATERQEGAVWLDPEDMANRIPKEYCGQGRMRFLSTKMSYVLRGHALSYGARSPDIDPMDMSMDFEAVMKTMAHYVSYPKVREVLSIVRNSDSRRFQVKVAQPDLPIATWKGLPWKVIAIRAVQGHNRAVVETAKISSLVKQVFTLDPTFVKEDLDSGKLPRTNLRPDLVPELMAALPRVIYHSCDRLAMEKIVEHGLIPGGWPQRTGRAHNFSLRHIRGMIQLEGKSLREREPESSTTLRLIRSSSSKAAVDCSGLTKQLSVLTGSPTKTSSAHMMLWIESSPGSIDPMRSPEWATTGRWRTTRTRTLRREKPSRRAHMPTRRPAWSPTSWAADPSVRARCRWPTPRKNFHHFFVDEKAPLDPLKTSWRWRWLPLVPCQMLKQSAKAKAAEKAGEREAAREGRPSAQPTLKITSTAQRLRCSRSSAISAGRRTLRARTSASHASNGWLHGRMEGSQLKYAGWKSRPRKQTRCFPWTRSTSRSSLGLRECQIAQEQTNVEQDEAISEISRTLLRLMREDTQSWGTSRSRTAWRRIHSISSTTRLARLLQTVASSWRT